MDLPNQNEPPSLRWIPAKLAELTGRNHDGKLIDRDTPEDSKCKSRMLFTVTSVDAEKLEGIETFEAAISRHTSAKRVTSHMEGDIEMAFNRSNKKRKQSIDLVDIDDDDEDDNDQYTPKASASKTNPANAISRHGGYPIPKQTPYVALTVPDPYPVQYEPTPQPSGRNKTYRGNPPPKKGGGLLDAKDWEETYRASYSRMFDVKYRKQIAQGEFTRDELQSRGFVRVDAVERLKMEEKVEEGFVDGKDFW